LLGIARSTVLAADDFAFRIAVARAVELGQISAAGNSNLDRSTAQLVAARHQAALSAIPASSSNWRELLRVSGFTNAELGAAAPLLLEHATGESLWQA